MLLFPRAENPKTYFNDRNSSLSTVHSIHNSCNVNIKDFTPARSRNRNLSELVIPHEIPKALSFSVPMYSPPNIRSANQPQNSQVISRKAPPSISRFRIATSPDASRHYNNTIVSMGKPRFLSPDPRIHSRSIDNHRLAGRLIHAVVTPKLQSIQEEIGRKKVRCNQLASSLKQKQKYLLSRVAYLKKEFVRLRDQYAEKDRVLDGIQKEILSYETQKQRGERTGSSQSNFNFS